MSESAQTREMTSEEQFRLLFERTAKLNDIASALLAPEWGARVGIIPEGHPLHPGTAATDSEATTPATTCSAQYTGPDKPWTACIRAARHEHPFHTDDGGWNWRDDTAVYSTDSTVRVAHWHPVAEQLAEERQELGQMVSDFIDAQMRMDPAADEEQSLRLLRRESLLVLLTRLQRGRTLSEEEAVTLRHHVETEIREANTARSVAASNKRHVQMIVPEIESLTAELKREQAASSGLAAKIQEQRSALDLIGHKRDVALADLKTADRIRADAQRDRDQHAAVLGEVLAAFVHKVDGYRVPRLSAEADVVTLEKWRSVVAPTVERPWWETVAEIRAELKEAQAAIERVRAQADAQRARGASGSTDHKIGLYDAAGAILAALDGTELPHETEA